MIRRTEQVIRQWVELHGAATVKAVNLDVSAIPGVRVVESGEVDVYAVLDGEVDMGQAQKSKVIIFETDGSSVSMRANHHPCAGIPKGGYQQEIINSQVVAFVASNVDFFSVLATELTDINVDDLKLSPEQIIDDGVAEEAPDDTDSFNFNIQGAEPPEDEEEDEEDEEDDEGDDEEPVKPLSPRIW